MIFEETRRRRLMKIRFDECLDRAKSIKAMSDISLELGDQEMATMWSERFNKTIAEASRLAVAIGDTGGYVIVLKMKLEEQIEKKVIQS